MIVLTWQFLQKQVRDVSLGPVAKSVKLTGAPKNFFPNPSRQPFKCAPADYLGRKQDKALLQTPAAAHAPFDDSREEVPVKNAR
jgi:hypothetical protein